MERILKTYCFDMILWSFMSFSSQNSACLNHVIIVSHQQNPLVSPPHLFSSYFLIMFIIFLLSSGLMYRNIFLIKFVNLFLNSGVLLLITNLGIQLMCNPSVYLWPPLFPPKTIRQATEVHKG